ncbi:MAG: ribosome silencing factor [Candidatus Omnitrophica bacterium]|nr:ribosome silencing factor [Candidatus Omnitrophota bacterium]
MAQAIARAAKSIKAENVVILDVAKIAGFCDYFVIASGNSLRQTVAIAQAIQDNLEKIGIKSLSKVPRGDESGWIALDYVSVIAHAFYKPMREFYSLESLWSDAKKVRVISAKR